MSNLNNFLPGAKNYRPAILRKQTNNWLIEYYVFNPIENQLERKRIRLNVMRKRYQRLADFKLAANDIVATINSKLAGGWTPYAETQNIRYYMPLDEVVAAYLKEKATEVRPDTMRSYNSFARMFLAWVAKNAPKCKCILFNKPLAIQYLDDYFNKHSSNARSYNNQLKLARALFSWAKDKCYTKENPFETVRAKRTKTKKRILVPADVRQQIRNYFENNRPEMLIVCELVYTSLIRPKEIARIQIGMLHLDQHYITLPGSITKNGNDRNAPLSNELCTLLADLVKNAPANWFLFGKGWKPAPASMLVTVFGKQWATMRQRLKLPDEMQLYSLRDTGIFDKLKAGIDPLTVMQAADHHDLEMTTRYANHIDPTIIDTIYNDADDF